MNAQELKNCIKFDIREDAQGRLRVRGTLRLRDTVILSKEASRDLQTIQDAKEHVAEQLICSLFHDQRKQIGEALIEIYNILPAPDALWGEWDRANEKLMQLVKYEPSIPNI